MNNIRTELDELEELILQEDCREQQEQSEDEILLNHLKVTTNQAKVELNDQLKECQLIFDSLQDIIILLQHVRTRYSENMKIKERTNYALYYLDVLSDQFHILLDLFEYNFETPKVKQLKGKYVFDSELYIKAKCVKEINISGLSHMNSIFNENTLQHLIRIGNKYIIGHIHRDSHSLIDELKIYNSHLNILVRIFASAIDWDQNDLICQSRTHPDWLNIQSVQTYTKLCKNPDQVQRSYYTFMKAIRIGHATFLRKTKFTNPWIKDLIFIFSSIWYFMLDSRASKRAMQHICDMHVDSAMSVMSLIEQPGIKHLIQLAISPIHTNLKIYIDPVVLPITLQYMKQQYLDGNINKITNDDLEYVNQSIHFDRSQIFKKSKTKLQIRILSSLPITRIQKEEHNFDYNIFMPTKLIDFDTIILHFHGGGFIAMSSSSHQNYTREWANQLGYPIFSVDYSLSPQYQYPFALDDCWQVYHWILKYMANHFNIHPKKILLAGDSAGGNLCVAITALCVKFGIRIPDGLLLSYPVLDLKMKYSPSHAYGLGDYLLSHTLMDICIDAYTKNPDCFEFDPFRSPNYLSDEILRHFPPTRILVGTKDPLLDHTHRLANSLLKNGVDLKITLYEGMSHGFLSFYLLGGMKESQQCIIDSIRYLKQLREYKQIKNELN